MSEHALMEIVRLALEELDAADDYEILSAKYDGNGWCAKLRRVKNRSEVAVCVDGRDLPSAVAGFKQRMQAMNLA